jgi:hypothetical protein
MILAHLALIASTVAGWSEITVQASRGSRAHGAQRNLERFDKPGERTMETLRRYDLIRTYRHDPDNTLAKLEKLARETPTAELVYALAELSFVEGRRLDRWRKDAAIDRYIDAVAYASDFLFDPEVADPQRAADPRFLEACLLYNGGLERLLRAAQAHGRIEPGATITIPAHGHAQVFRVTLRDSPWKDEDVDKLILSSDLEVTGLENRSYQPGLGVPLIGVRVAEQPGKGEERFYPPEMAFPLTAFLVPNSRLRTTNPDAPRECSLMLFDPVRTPTVGPPGLALLVEADLTTPLAYMWSKTDLNHYRWTGLIHPGEALGRANLILLRPYEPDKIPVVMVHGLISSPLAWIPMLNELLRDPTIQKRYQFLLYMYPTGVPIPIAAAGLRDSLNEARRMYNADDRAPAFDQMVLLGHSLGGVLSHAMAVDSQNYFWQLSSDRQFDRILGPPSVLAELRRYLFFEHLPYVRRVVFLGTPHRGAEMSRGVVGRVGSSLISEPDHISNLLRQLIKDNPDAFDARSFRRMPTSIETLEPDSPSKPSILTALRSMPPGPDVVFHSIIGSLRPGGVADSTDGVVSYRSSHLDGVASERLVRSDHGVQKSPEAILEVQRILMEHVSRPRPAVARTPDPQLQAR